MSQNHFLRDLTFFARTWYWPLHARSFLFDYTLCTFQLVRIFWRSASLFRFFIAYHLRCGNVDTQVVSSAQSRWALPTVSWYPPSAKLIPTTSVNWPEKWETCARRWGSSSRWTSRCLVFADGIRNKIISKVILFGFARFYVNSFSDTSEHRRQVWNFCGSAKSVTSKRAIFKSSIPYLSEKVSVDFGIMS